MNLFLILQYLGIVLLGASTLAGWQQWAGIARYSMLGGWCSITLGFYVLAWYKRGHPGPEGRWWQAFPWLEALSTALLLTAALTASVLQINLLAVLAGACLPLCVLYIVMALRLRSHSTAKQDWVLPLALLTVASSLAGGLWALALHPWCIVLALPGIAGYAGGVALLAIEAFAVQPFGYKSQLMRITGLLRLNGPLALVVVVTAIYLLFLRPDAAPKGALFAQLF